MAERNFLILFKSIGRTVVKNRSCLELDVDQDEEQWLLDRK